ncbi:hypothetical protein AB0B86_07905 [Micromonospora sp. NPDC049047]|uniref:hypothetical protein n=1 Tax=Micromonospora sp. NPDC049047 TaxID=3155645 RepID=UPI0033E06A91
MDEYEASDEAAVKDRLRYPAAIARVHELANQGQRSDYSDVPPNATTVAGPGLEFDAPGMCADFSCQAQNADTNYGKLLHYYDYVVLQGPYARGYLHRLDNLKSKKDHLNFEWTLVQDVLLLAHLRSIGLANHVIFKSKKCYCSHHVEENAKLLGLGHLVNDEAVRDLAVKTSREGGVHITQDGPRSWYIRLTSPLFAGSAGAFIEGKTKPKKVAAAESILREWLTAAVFDAATAHEISAPLTAHGPTSLFDYHSDSGKSSVDDVAARIRIPVLQGLNTREIIELRDNEYEHFEKFRQLLREAVAETISKADTDSPEKIADMVWRYKVKPEVADIERKIKASDKSIIRKLTATALIGGLAAAVGNVANLPWLIGVGTAAASIPMSQVVKAYDDRQQIEGSGMYFLWKADQAHGD